jgi:hypothetical protein
VVRKGASAGIPPRENMNVTVLSDIERRAVDYASMSMRQTVAEVSRVFYAMKPT